MSCAVQEYGVEKIRALLEEFQKEAPLMLLFLKSLEHMEVRARTMTKFSRMPCTHCAS